jgi:tRNA-dihydrouridine synthase C
MEGVLDWVLRELLSEVGGVDRMVTEFVRVTDRLLPAHVFHRYCPELQQGGRTLTGTPVFIQLLGGQAAPVAENAAFAVELGAPGIDLNFGCPAKTVNRHDGGAALLKDPSRVYEVTRAVREAVPAAVPVTVKVRLGFDHKDFHREIAAAAEAAGASHIVVHARTKTEMYTPPAHWEYIASMREGRTLRFLANGEIRSAEDYWACVAKSGVTDVALGRGLVRRPTLALEIRASVAARVGVASLPPRFDQIDFLQKFFARSSEFRSPTYAVARLKQILRYWSVVRGDAADWFQLVKVLHDAAAIEQFLCTLKEETPWPMSKFTANPVALSASAPKTY